jgi:hypothetical protein
VRDWQKVCVGSRSSDWLVVLDGVGKLSNIGENTVATKRVRFTCSSFQRTLGNSFSHTASN